ILVNEQGACRIYSLPAGGGPLRLEFERAVNVLALSVNRTSGSAACCAAKIMDCGDIYALRLDGSGAAGRLTHVNRRLFDRLHLTTPEEVVFRRRRNGGVPIHGWILKPPRSRTGRRHPTILNIHGGPMAQFGYTFFHEMHFLAASGYVVVFTNPRGSSGYGLRFMNCIENRWGGLDYADLMAVADSMIRRPYVDPDRMGVMGGSYGGFMTTWIVGHTRRFKAAVTERQVGNQVTQSGSSDLGFYRIYARGYYPWEKPLAYLRNSPNFHAARIRTPLLIIHSENDLRCPIAQAEELFTYLKLQRRTVEMVRFAGESHGLSRGGKPQNRRERLARIAEWFAKWL
ncbi:MAG: S9 family peptidase, partial [Candidatus Eisenbacteria bacterium]